MLSTSKFQPVFDPYPYATGSKQYSYTHTAEDYLTNFSLASVYSGSHGLFKKVATWMQLDFTERYLVIGYRGGDIQIRDTENKFQVVRTFLRPHNSPSAATPAVSSNSDGGHKSAVTCVQWYVVDSGLLFSASLDKTMKLWDVEHSRAVRTFTFSEGALSLDQSQTHSNYHLVAVSTVKDRVHLLDLVSGKFVHNMKPHTGPVFTVAWSPREQHLLCTGGGDGKCFLWDLRSPKNFLKSLDQFSAHTRDADMQSESCAHNGAVLQAQYTHDGFHLVTLGSDSLYRHWDMTTFHNAPVHQGHSNVRSLTALVPNYQFQLVTEELTSPVAIIPDQFEVSIIDLNSGQSLDVMKGHCRKVCSVVYNQCRNEVYSAGEDENLLVWRNALSY